MHIKTIVITCILSIAAIQASSEKYKPKKPTHVLDIVSSCEPVRDIIRAYLGLGLPPTLMYQKTIKTTGEFDTISYKTFGSARGYSLIPEYRGDQHTISIAISPDERVTATARTNSNQIEVTIGDTKITLRPHFAGIYGLAFSPDGSYLASGSKDGTIKIWAIQVPTVLDESAHNGCCTIL